MGHAHVMKWLILATMAINIVGGLTGCDGEKEKAEKLGQEMTRDSPGWERVRREMALPPEQRQKEIVAPTGPISPNWSR